MKKYKEIKTNEESNKTVKRSIALMSILILIGLTIFIGASYSLFSIMIKGEKKVSIQTGTFKVEMEDGEYIKVDALGTMSDEEGKASKPYIFTVSKNAGTIGAYYSLYLTEESGELNTYYLKYELKGTDGSIKEGRIGALDKFYWNKYLEAGGIVTYELRLWLDKDTPNSEQGNSYQSKIALEGSQISKSFIMPETPMKEYINPIDTNFNDETKDKMFIYHHEAGAQQENWTEEELTDYRYIGANPNNYVTFNGEKAGWRIIGIFTVENEQGKKEQRIKLIRNDFLRTSSGDFISYDNKSAGIGSSEGGGSNKWAEARLMMLLNPGYEDNPLASDGKGSIYWNSETGKCPLGSNDVTVDCDFTSTGLTPEAQNMIGDAKWYLGGWSSSKRTASQFYTLERGNLIYKNRFTFWKGKVGLMYPSDYGYATSGGDKCSSTTLYEWKNITSCINNNWIYIPDTHQWTILPRPDYSSGVFYIDKNGHVSDSYCSPTAITTRPTIYLKSNVQLKSGKGTKEDPFVFTL